MPGTLDDSAVEKLIKAGRIAERVREEAARLVRPGETARSICEKLEEYTRELGGEPAFPCNFSVNHVAAHYTPALGSDVTLKGDEVVKVDVGVHVDGYIADTAVTVDLSGRYEKLLEASRAGLEAAMRTVRPGVSLLELGRRIEAAVKSHGYKVIRNLTGHTIDRYTIHAGLSIPNYPDRSAAIFRLRPGMVVAIEPFATNGRGLITETRQVTIYAYTGKTPRRAALTSEEARLLEEVKKRFHTLPFTPRWLEGAWDGEKLDSMLKRMASRGVLHAYPVLVEAGRGMVSQFEHTFIILKDNVIVTTCSSCQ